MQYFFTDFTPSDLEHLSKVEFIPIVQSTSINRKAIHPQPDLVLFSPSRCYLKKESDTGFHSHLFTFIDFGTRANGFLMACGVRPEPTVEELAQILVSDPRYFFKLAGDTEQ